MAKEEYETPLIDVYNRTHMDALHEDGSWYHRFLPDGVFLEDLGQIVEEELIKAYSEVEREADKYFEDKVKERFAEIFAQANPRDLRGLLPKKPPVAWAELPVEIQREIQVMHDSAEGEKITERTLKKRVRQYLVDQFIIDE
ncbi:MAG: hypothetical protein CXT75_03210 [Methanobacteriota archaeon]|jgi:hypothetical protein|nr:hypothetical protein [Candidatus Poseidoniia archaeon]RZD37824.1 MAG: hypothetical protein CXT75_03210 [Euryarchaeota archaeon]|tara:strand:+ start:342 stop:767 length:426 start_codon:yes stop_codon:yes gene_type:complete